MGAGDDSQPIKTALLAARGAFLPLPAPLDRFSDALASLGGESPFFWGFASGGFTGCLHGPVNTGAQQITRFLELCDFLIDELQYF